MDYKARLEVVVREGLDRIRDESEENQRFRSRWVSKQQEFFEVFTAAKDFLTEKLGRARVLQPKGQGGPVVLEVTVVPGKLPGTQDLVLDKDVTYTLSFASDPRNRKVVAATKPDALLGLDAKTPPVTLELSEGEATSPEEWVVRFVKAIMADQAQRKVR